MKNMQMTATDELLSLARQAACTERAARIEMAMLMLRVAVSLDAGRMVMDVAKGEKA